MNKIIFLDIDGTIRDFDGYIPPSAIEAVRTARENGHKVCISSGRPICQIEPRVMDIGFDGIVSGSGSYVEYQGKCVSHRRFTMLTYLNLCEYLFKRGCIMELQTYRESYIPERCKAEYEALNEHLAKHLGEGGTRGIPMPTVIASMMDVRDTEKILYFGSEEANRALLERWGTSLHIVTFGIPGTGRWGGEITPLSINKGEGMKSILRAGGFNLEDVIAVGDSGNDREMLELAAVGVAMGNGTDEIKRLADMATASLREDGLSKAFCRLKLI